MDEALLKHRQYLVETLQKISESYDKTVITLAAGGIGCFLCISQRFPW